MLRRIRNLFGKRDPKQPSGEESPPEAVPAVHRGPSVVHRPIDPSDLDPDAVKIVNRLTRFDHNAYLVGGCVRDLLLDRKPKDFDIGTSATPRQMKRLFRNCRIIGRRFRLAHIYFQGGKIIEVATFRALDDQPENDEDGEERDLMIRDDNIFGTPEEDALRRDFTINSLFYEVADGNVLDHADGLNDLRRGLVRTIGDPAIRFREDPIRILRAIKFAARLNFRIEGETLKGLKQTRNEIPKAAAPRILEELHRYYREGASRRSFELMRETGTFDVILPELAGGYANDPGAWQLVLELLSAADTRQASGKHDLRMGELFAVLLLPLVESEFGWSRDGRADPPRGLKPRELVDRPMQPIALRLRVPRREQESCRQILTTLLRMVPVKRIRRHVQRSILNRECLEVCLEILATLGRLRGGDYEEAAKFWTNAAQQSGPPARRPEGRSSREPATEDSEATPARRRRRRSRRARTEGGPAVTDGPRRREPAADDEPRKQLPEKWDDNYFFSALPSVPEVGGETDDTDRYGAEALDPRKRSAEIADDRSETPTEESRPRRRKRSRRRRRRPDSDDNSDGADGDKDTSPANAGGSRKQ